MKLYLVLLLLLSSRCAFAQVSDWDAGVEMDDQLYPSYILAHAGLPALENDTIQVDNKPYYIINEDGTAQIIVTVELPKDSDVKIELLASKINEYSVYEEKLEQGNYGIYPKINYLYDVLRAQTQPTPLNLIFVLTVNGKRIGQKTVTVSLRSVSECPYAQTYAENEIPEDMNYMFAAYVNEDHPQVDILLKEALATGIVSQFSGYQGNNAEEIKQNVINQVVAIWAAMAHRGIKYSSITNTSNSSATVRSQRVRSFEDVMNNNQANCVDGSVFMCSVLTEIGIKPFLVTTPIHCYIGFYLDEKKENPYMLETTMIGGADMGRLKRGSSEANQLAIDVFNQANDYATDAFNKSLKYINDEKNRDYQLVDIEDIRATIKPIGR